MANIAIDITVRCYLTRDINPDEAKSIVEVLDCTVKHELIEKTELFEYEFIQHH